MNRAGIFNEKLAKLESKWGDYAGVDHRTSIIRNGSKIKDNFLMDSRVICAFNSKKLKKNHPWQCLLFIKLDKVGGWAGDRIKYLLCNGNFEIIPFTQENLAVLS